MTTDAETRVLVVEDEPLLRMAAIDMLEDAGFLVEQAANSREALVVLHSVRDLHVLFTDVHMPGEMNGIALAHHTARAFPAIHLVIVSGQARPAPGELPLGAMFLPKPYEARKVVAHIRERRRAA